MPPVPKPKRIKKGNQYKPWLSSPTTTFHTEPETPQYVEQKEQAIAFWARGLRLPAWAWGACCVCGAWFSQAQQPATHHGIIPRNHGVRIDEWWNLFPVCSEHCHTKLHTKGGMAQALGKLYIRISRYILNDDPPSPIRGHQWVVQQVACLDLTDMTFS